MFIEFRGPPDPLRGDEIYRRVRDAAKEALDAIFDSQMPVTTSAVAAANRIQGMGNDYVPAEGSKKEQTGFISSMVSSITTVVMGDGTDAVYAGHAGAQNSFIGGAAQQLPPPAQSSYTSPGYSGPSGGGMIRASSSGMSGIGNPNFKDAREEKSWYQKAGELASNISTNLSISSGPASQPSLNLSSPHPDYSYATNRGPNAVANNEGYSAHRVQNALGSNASTGSFQNWQNNAGGFQSAQHAGVVPDLPATANNLGIVGRVGGAAADGEYERSLIEPLVEPGGLKPVPPEHKLQDFLLAAQTLSPELVGNCLADVLNSDAWQSRVKALIVVAALVLNKECSAHADWWRANVELVRALLSDAKAGVRTQATKTCKIIGGEDDVSAPVSTSASPKPSTKERSLLGDFHDEPVAPAPAPAASHSLLDMLDDSPAPVSTPLAPPSLSQPPAPSSGGDLFSGLSIGGTPYLAVAPAAAPAPAPVPAPVAAPVPAPSVSDAFDFLSDAPIVAAPPAAPAAAGGLFDNLQMASSVPPSSSAKANYRDDFAGLSMGPSSANSVSSSFSFMNAGPAPVPTSSPLGRPAPSSSVISTAFVEPSSSSQKSKNDQAFAQVSLLLTLPLLPLTLILSWSTSARPVPTHRPRAGLASLLSRWATSRSCSSNPTRHNNSHSYNNPTRPSPTRLRACSQASPPSHPPTPVAS